MNGELGDTPAADEHEDRSESETTPPTVTPPPVTPPPVLHPHTDSASPMVPASLPPPKPRVWTVFLSLGIIFAAQIGVGIVIAVVLLVMGSMSGGSENALANLIERMEYPWVLAGTVVLSELAIFGVAMGAARFSRQKTVARLGLNRSALGWLTWPLLILSTLGVGTIGQILLEATLGSIGDSLAAFYQSLAEMELSQLIPMALVLSVFPGVCEEMFFRGYMQRRLLQRWHPAVAIGITSMLFAAIHLDPYQALGVFLTGVWLGIVAWRTGSIWPGVACHIVMNFLSVMGASLMVEETVDINPIWPLAWYAILLGSMIVSVILLVKAKGGEALGTVALASSDADSDFGAIGE